MQFLDVIKKLLNNMADVIPHYAKAVHIMPPCDKDVISAIYYVCFLPPNLRVICQWLSTGHLLLDLYHARFSQGLHITQGMLGAYFTSAI